MGGGPQLAGKQPPDPPVSRTTSGGSRAPYACLIVLYGQEVGRKFDVERGTTTIGRSETNGICLWSEGISRTHATLVRTDRGVVIRDEGSTNGTYVNDQRIEEAALQSGDLRKLGAALLKFLVGDDLEGAYYDESACHQELYRLATVDRLTQVFNRRYFREMLAREIGRTQRRNAPLSVVMVDIDHFRRYNETFGHPAGDRVLRQLADLIRRSAREIDVVARWGRDELSILLSDTGLEDALAFGEMIRRAVEDARFVFDEQRIPITISVGVAALESSETDADGFVGRAVARLQRAKERGGNVVEH